MKRRILRRPAFRLHKPRFETLEERAVLATAWGSFGGNPQHTSISTVTAQPLEAIHWSTPVDNFPTSRAAHYGGPLITLNNTVIYPYKTGNTQAVNTPDFHVVARNGNDGSLVWDYSTPYVPLASSWYPGYQPVYASATNRVYFQGKGGTIYYRDNPDSPNGAVTQLAFFGSLAHYQSNQAAYDDNVFIDTPLTADDQGNIYFGYRVTGTTPTNLVSGVAKINANGTISTAAGIWKSAAAASGNDANMVALQQNGAPAISNDGQTVYLVVKGGGEGASGRLLGLSTANLSTQYNSGILKDPRGANAVVLNISTSSPMVAPDGRVFIGVFGNPYNGSRGWMLQFSGDLQTQYATGGFGWDTTPSIVPASMLGSRYTGTSSYLIFTKYNNYYFPNGANDGGDGQNAIAILDPNATEVEFHHPEQNIQVMRRVLHKVGPTPDWDYPTVPTAVREWCINYGAVDPSTNSVIVNSSDGKFYRWHLPTDSLVEPIQLTSGIGQPYTMTVIGVDGTVYGIQMGRLFAMGETPKMSIGDISLSEGNNGLVNATFQVSLNYPRTEMVTAAWATADDTAKAGSDYIAGSGILVFDPGVKTRTITVAVNADTLDEIDESFFINLSGAGEAIIVDAQGKATIVDDDAQPSIAIGDLALNEGNTGTSTFEFLVSLGTPSGRTINIDWATSNSTAIAGTDYVAANGTLTFLPGETQKQVAITVNGDTTFEASETFFVTLSNAINAVISDNRATGTITNDDGVPSMSISDVSSDEGTNFIFVVSLSNSSSQTITVAYQTETGTASATDFTAKTGTLSFSPGSTSRTITIASLNDALSEATENFSVKLLTPNNGFILDDTGTGSILDNDPLPTLSVANVSAEEGAEGNKPFTFVATLSAPSGQVVSFDYATADDTAMVSANDYLAAAGTIVFQPGEVSKSITVFVRGDDVNEATESFSLNLSEIVGATASSSSATGTILNDDALILSINNVTANEGAAGTTLFVFTVSISSPNADPVTVDYATADDTAKAASGDYQASTGTITFAPGVLTRTVSVVVNNDALNEATERFFLTLSNPVGAMIGDGIGDGIIEDNDAMPSFIISDFSEPELNYNQAPFTVYVSLSAPSGQTVTVDFRTENGTATSTSNIKDYIDTLGTLTFAPGETVKSFPVTIVGDTRHELDETVRVILTNGQNANIVDDTSIITITNDDVAYVTITGMSVTETDRGVVRGTATVALDIPSDLVITIDYASLDGTAIAGQDYKAISGKLTFLPSEQSKTIPFEVLADTLDESDEFFEIELTSQTGGALLPDYAEVDIDIVDNDTSKISVRDVSIVEGNSGPSNALFSVLLSTAADHPISVSYATSDFGATAGVDYISQNNVMTFLPGQTSRTVVVPVIGDVKDEPNERFKLTLSGVTGGATLLDGLAYGSITNDDNPQFTMSDVVITEGTGGVRNAVMTVSLSRPAVSAVSVNFATAPGTALAGSDFTSVTGTLNFGVGVRSQTITVPITTDNVDEADETFTIVLSNATGASRIEDGVGQVTIRDDDTARFFVNNVRVTEGNSGTVAATFTVTLSTPVDRAVSVAYATALGTASATDYTALSGILSFPALLTSKTVSVLVKGDLVDELDEMFTLNLSNPTGGLTIGDASGTATIQDDDTTRISINDVSTNEPSSLANAVFTVTLSNPSSRTVTVNYATFNGTAVSPADYTSATGMLTFAPGETSKQVVVSVKGDLIDEVDETYTVRLATATGGASILDSSGTGTIVDNDTSRISIANLIKDEGHTSTSVFSFLVTLSNPSSRLVTVRYATANNTATTAAGDYIAKTGVLSFSPGEVSKSVAVSVRGDRLVESNETFWVNLSSAVGATLLDGQALGTIRNDDVLARGAGGEGEGESAASMLFASSTSSLTRNASTDSLDGYLGEQAKNAGYGPREELIDFVFSAEGEGSDDFMGPLSADEWLNHRRRWA